MDLSREERLKLAQQFRQEMAQQKAEEMGLNPNDLMVRVSDGRMSWVQKAKVYGELEKQRQLATPKKVIRSLRGEDSLVNRIKQEIQVSTQMVNDPLMKEFVSALDLSDYRNSIEKIGVRLGKLAVELQAIEDKIESTKRDDPIFKQGETLLVQLAKAKEAQDQQQLADLATTYKDLLVEYTTKRKNLEPLMLQARSHRLELQREYWRILQIHWKIETAQIAYYRKLIKSQYDQTADMKHKADIKQASQSLATALDELAQKQRELASRCPPRHIELPLATGALDAINPDMKLLTDNLADIKFQWAALFNQGTDKTKAQSQRMAYIKDIGQGPSKD
ncbi:MAG: hypothetical protein RBU29_02785 [bacterium]|jgi:hypothetical protein|nr:hypothetical protein [bacterium]